MPLANAGMRKFLYIAGGTMNCYGLFGKQSDSIHKNKNKMNMLLDLAILFLGTYPIEMKIPKRKPTFPKMFTMAPFIKFTVTKH